MWYNAVIGVIVGGWAGFGVRLSSLRLTAPVRDLIDVANGSLTFEDLLSVLLGFTLSHCNQNTGRCPILNLDAYFSQHGAPGFLCVPYDLFFPRRGVYDHTRCCAITGLSGPYR